MTVTACGVSVTSWRRRDADRTVGNSVRNSRSESSAAVAGPAREAMQNSAHAIGTILARSMFLPGRGRYRLGLRQEFAIGARPRSRLESGVRQLVNS